MTKKTSKAKDNAPDGKLVELPPYGIFPDFYRRHGVGDGKIPGDWKHANSPQGEDAFSKWREDRLAEIRDGLWPEWVPGSGWQGKAAAFAAAMTKREIEIMTEQFVKADKLNQNPFGFDTDHPMATHLAHYEFEDGRLYGDLISYFHEMDENHDRPAIGRNFFLYENTPQDALTQKAFLDGISTAYSGKTNQFYFWFKQRLMRLRPFQAALIFGISEFQSRRAITAMHSSIVSGHASTGILIRCGALENWLYNGDVPELMLTSFKRYIMDVGDRRVFAGVHYPTDNISSWVLALKLIPHVFKNRPKAVMGIVLDAITKHSDVFNVIESQYQNDQHLGRAFTYLQRHLAAAEAEMNSLDQ